MGTVSGARYIDDVKRYPVDRMARRVTAPGPRWCAPGEKPEAALARLLGSEGSTKLRGHYKNPKTRRLVDRLDERRMVVFARVFEGRPSTTLAQRIGFAKYLLGHPLKDHHRRGLARLGIHVR